LPTTSKTYAGSVGEGTAGIGSDGEREGSHRGKTEISEEVLRQHTPMMQRCAIPGKFWFGFEKLRRKLL
jgi:hypothetical protein